MFKMRANRGCFICLSFLLLFCQLPKIDAKARNAESDSYCQWSEGECSRSCGGGVKKSTLTCLNNRSDGLSSKKELKFKYTSCNTQNCPDQRSYRALQCAMYNKKPVDGHYYKWKPFYSDGDDVCALVCAVNRTFHAKLADKVVDGTRCRPDGYDICVNGKCKSAGCDRKLGSNLVDDACRVCGGEGKDCKTVEGDYENENNKGYKDIITILKGATNIYIDEEGKTKNYFALRDVFAKFYLNSQWNLIEHKKFIAVGTMFHYQKDSNGQSLIALGPTTDALTLVLVGKGDPTKIHYEYYIPEKGHVSKPVAGQRMQRRRRRRPQNNVKTQTTKPDRPSREEQPQSRSSLSKIRADRDEKLQTRRRTARNYPLPSADTPLPSGDAPPTWDARRSVANYEWVHGMWTKCSATCGEGIQRRAVQCFSRQTRELSEGKCSEEDKPQSIQKCEMPCDSSFQWVEAGWTDCSQSCGGGEMSSISVCEEITKSGTKRVKEKYCEETLGPSPRQMKVCNEHQCQASPAKRAPPCWETLYGCCLDRRTAASGPDHAGCGESHAECQNTQHGCCPDGVTIARGERYAGCPSVPLERLPAASPTSAALTDSGHVCQMKMDTGNCGDYKIHWGYNVSTGRCEQFWYGGCGGNDNRFEDERACLMACRGTRTTRVRSRPTATSPREVPNSPREPSSSDVCQMKMDTGNCGDYKIHWGYNVSTGRCEQFWYGGCGGNDNRFEDERACLMACRGTRTTRVQPRPTATSPREVPNSPREPSSSVASETHTDDQVCELDADVGSCSDYVTKWFYNSTSAKCQQFWYGGCRGNDNKFDTERDCQMKCRGRRTSNCASLPFGCCEDGTTAARGPQRLGCPEGDCQRSRYGCCPDGTTPARGQEQEGCDTRDCRISKYGCCQDGRSFARGENYGGCPQPRCNESRYGCCPDGVSFAQGGNYAGCRRINECERTEYGCCPDQRTTAQGPNGEGCCHYTEFGCCPDGLTVSGPNHEKCRTQDCRRSRYGCCRDGVNFARGENFKGCPSTDCRTSEAGCCPDGVTFVSEGCAPPDCHSTRYGCCPDGRTIARGYYQEGCREKDCRQSEYGCCPDGVSYAKGEEFLGCPTCRDTKYGCCPDGTTVAKGNDYLGCTLGSCHLSDYGCCPDMRTVAMGPEHLGCKEKDCRQYRYGCCEDGITYARGRNMDGCPKNVERCTLSRYGCCEDGRTEAQGPERYGCPETLCTYSEFGCCEDGVTFAKGREFEGCPGRQLRGCAGTRYGCCEDGRTAAQGPERYGCPETLCTYSKFGCCEDGVTFAKGREFEGCPERRLVGGCAGTRYGCCEDGRTAAQGPERYGCPETLCAYSEFGCCEDGVTFAKGREFEGCPERRLVGGCAGTRYGCCEDGRTAAQGPERYGCPETLCAYSEFGCCEDGVTFAKGREFEGCPERRLVGGCAGTRYGCCEDGRTAAQGPERYGCPETQCVLSEYGCCPDGRTSARGPDLEGCRRRDCRRSIYGCCPDGVSFARGPEYSGCEIDLGCEASPYGCCPDMSTAARGPDYAGCPPGGCRATRYGCCPDKVTSADGPNYAGCDLRSNCESPFGCCPDGITAARGPDYAGCVVPTKSTEVDCESDKDTGTCSEYVTKWYFNRNSSKCEQFWYGGCGGNHNRYDNERECNKKCRRRRASPTSEAPLDPCHLPHDEGTCSSSNAVRRWYYEDSSRSCQVFWYSGCDGNANNFESESACVQRCFLHPINGTLAPTEPPLSRNPLEICHLELQAGACSKELIMWHYDKQDGLCKNFTYSGCYGNSNRFPSKESCEAVCSREAVCNFKEAYGTCQSNIRRYRYDAERGDCVAFRYSGCNGNANNFVTVDACRTKCGVLVEPSIATTTERPVKTIKPTGLAACSLEKDESYCADGIQRTRIAWYYDLSLAACQQFNYSGCGGNNNRFTSAEECTRTCNPRDICQMPNESEFCSNRNKVWYFNMSTRKCESFYGRCGGNANRFPTKTICKKTCRALMSDLINQPTVPILEKTKDACLLPQKPSSCHYPVGDNVWFYNMSEGICQLFDPEACSFNDNRFSSREECESTCDPRELCTLPSDSGTCSEYFRQYYFNPTVKRCEIFVYGGCGGNANRFPSIEHCEKTCNALLNRGISTGPVELPDDQKIAIMTCHLPAEIGPCQREEYKWYYEVKEGRCRQFTYGGCQGNNNRFETKEECETTCSSEVICSFSKDAGSCTPYHRGFYFNLALNRCEHLDYGDCYGNANRFYNIELCQQKCKALIRQPVVTTPASEPRVKSTVMDCHLPKQSGSCRARLPVWFYDTVDNTCKQFYYGGCEGNANRFQSKEECEKTCNAYDICHLPQESGRCLAYIEVFYFNPQSKRCEPFVYGGCGGNANRFSSLEICHIACRDLIQKPVTPDPSSVSERPITPVEVCHLEKKVGSCRSQISTWYYDIEDKTCKHFYYGGCEGNGNRFQTREECESICNPNDICNLPKEAGRCYAYSMQYHFNSQTRRCEEFVYGGCGGNANRFNSIEKCVALCHSLIEQTTTQPITTVPTVIENPVDVCHLEKKVGPCYSQLPVWHYDAVDHQCKQFYFGGCDGNANNFASKEECQQKCNHKSICELPKKSGHCYSYSEQYYFNSRTKRCEQFVYGGCGGNANRFSSASKCMEVCRSLIEIIPTPPVTNIPPYHSVESCHLEKKVGPCRSQLSSWYYDIIKQECKHFYYGGCDGNANRFESNEECHQMCNPQSICTLPKEPGKCYAYSEQYYFNSRTRRCEQFVYGGCGGNANRFSSASKCMEVCKSLMHSESPEPTRYPHINPVESCHLEKKVGPCRSQLSSWYYDIIKQECKHFYYGGCDGNANRFESNEECHQMCNPQSICTLPKEPGKCYAYSEQYYFNSRTRRCEQFVYGGCGGNANRFSSASKCMEVCKSLMHSESPEPTRYPHINPELCQFPRDSGACFNYSEIYYFDKETNRCEQFVYSGCGGNANRFQTLSECREVCRPVEMTKKPVTKIDVPDTPKRDKEVCRLQKLIGPCSSNITAWYFDENYGVCSKFLYSGCGGNKNNFRTLEECENVCQPTNDVCNHPMAVKQCQSSRAFWAYDKANQTCRYFSNGHCEENPLHFSSESACHRQCKHQDAETESVCHFRMEEGSCRAYVRLWYYDMDEAICKPFIYGGCEGNKNRFDTKQKCDRVCNKDTICKLKKDSGICYAYTDAFYFNSEKNMCEHFVYGGCGGNANRFSSMNQCHNICGGHLSHNTHGPNHKGKCQMEPDSGSCGERNLFWYYDFKTRDCLRFYYTGCEGNDNRFTTQDECLASCKPFSPITTYAPSTDNSLVENPKNRFTTIHVAPKGTLTLHCGELIDSTGEGIPVTWTHEGRDIVPSARKQTKNLDLIVYDVTSQDAGMYSCREKSNTVTPSLDKYKVILKVPVTIDYGPSHQSSLPNHLLRIPCQAHGVPKPLITWYKDDRQIHNDNHYRIFENGTLLINPFTTNDVATYKCLARNGYEDKAEKEVKVTIQDSLKLQIKKSSQNLHVGDKITLTCIAEGYPNTQLQWFYKDIELYSNDHIIVRDGVLIIRKATYDNSGVYTCRGTHGRDQVNKDESIRILSKPDEVPNVCEDRLPINRCRMIVAVKLCKRKTFHRNCCVSCSRSMETRR